jgi:hypothetical protein
LELELELELHCAVAYGHCPSWLLILIGQLALALGTLAMALDVDFTGVCSTSAEAAARTSNSEHVNIRPIFIFQGTVLFAVACFYRCSIVAWSEKGKRCPLPPKLN